MNFAELTQVALLGTERQTLKLPEDTSAFGQLRSQLASSRREDALLAAAALTALHEQIGRLPGGDVGPVPAPCSAEDLPRISERAGSFLLRLLSGEHVVLLPEFLALARQAGQVALPEALPLLLSLGADKPELREEIAPILGLRGQWLAALNPPWSWLRGAASDDENIWQVGEPAARLMFLRRLRCMNPNRARELLMATWKEESSDDRARFMGALENGLAPEDEAFLESALDDKRKEVRRAASALLGRLPESALVQRMVQRASPLLRFIPAEAGSLLKLKKGKAAMIDVTLPGECDKAMQRDGIELKPPPSMGEKAWWLVQMLEFVPLEHWAAEWQIPPSDILAASLAGEWKKELFEAWLRAASQQRNREWADLLSGAALETQQFDKLRLLLHAMSPAQREARLAELLHRTAADVAAPLPHLVAECRTQWSLEFSQAALAWLKRLTAEKSTDWSLRNQIKEMAPFLDPSSLPEALHGWPTEAEGWEFWSKGVDEFLSLVQFRADIHAAFVNRTHS